jgi:hypothetical protein
VFLRVSIVLNSKLNKFSALLLLMAVLFVGNNLAHDATHTVSAQTSAQVECDTCHVFKGTLVSQILALPSVLPSAEHISTVQISATLNSRFSEYLSRAPPKI